MIGGETAIGHAKKGIVESEGVCSGGQDDQVRLTVRLPGCHC